MYSGASRPILETPAGFARADPCASDGVGVAGGTNTSEATASTSKAGSVTNRMGMTQRISPIGPLCGSGGVIETTMQSCVETRRQKKKKKKRQRGATGEWSSVGMEQTFTQSPAALNPPVVTSEFMLISPANESHSGPSP